MAKTAVSELTAVLKDVLASSWAERTERKQAMAQSASELRVAAGTVEVGAWKAVPGFEGLEMRVFTRWSARNTSGYPSKLFSARRAGETLRSDNVKDLRQFATALLEAPKYGFAG